jgi:hypothetical protein
MNIFFSPAIRPENTNFKQNIWLVASDGQTTFGR